MSIVMKKVICAFVVIFISLFGEYTVFGETEDELNEGDTFGSVESVKTVSELYAPVSGKIVETNDELEDSPEFVNESPYEKAWMVKVELSDESQLDELLSAEQYSEMIGE